MTYVNEHFTPTAITAAKPVSVTIADHGFSNGDRVRASNFVSFPIAEATGMEQLNNRLFVVKQCTTNTFNLFDVYDQPIDGSNYTAFVNNGLAQFTLTGPDLGIIAT